MCLWIVKKMLLCSRAEKNSHRSLFQTFTLSHVTHMQTQALDNQPVSVFLSHSTLHPMLRSQLHPPLLHLRSVLHTLALPPFLTSSSEIYNITLKIDNASTPMACIQNMYIFTTYNTHTVVTDTFLTLQLRINRHKWTKPKEITKEFIYFVVFYQQLNSVFSSRDLFIYLLVCLFVSSILKCNKTGKF